MHYNGISFVSEVRSAKLDHTGILKFLFPVFHDERLTLVFRVDLVQLRVLHVTVMVIVMVRKHLPAHSHSTPESPTPTPTETDFSVHAGIVRIRIVGIVIVSTVGVVIRLVNRRLNRNNRRRRKRSVHSAIPEMMR